MSGSGEDPLQSSPKAACHIGFVLLPFPHQPSDLRTSALIVRALHRIESIIARKPNNIGFATQTTNQICGRQQSCDLTSSSLFDRVATVTNSKLQQQTGNHPDQSRRLLQQSSGPRATLSAGRPEPDFTLAQTCGRHLTRTEYQSDLSLSSRLGRLTLGPQRIWSAVALVSYRKRTLSHLLHFYHIIYLGP